MNREIAAKVLDTTFLNGGGTFDLFGEPISAKTGYVTAISTGTFRQINIDEPDLVLQGILDTYRKFGTFVGTWIEGNFVHIDPVSVFDARESAEKVARAYKQLAIYDLEAGETIYV